MKRLLSVLLVLCAFFILCGATATWELPEGTALYRPGGAMETDFGTFTVLDAGFCKKAQSIIQVSTTGSVINGISETTEHRNIGYYTAKDGRALFAVTGVLHNSTDKAIQLDTLFPMVSFGAEEPFKLYGYPAVSFTDIAHSSLEPGADVEIVFAGTAPNALYYGGMDLLMDFCGGKLGFERGDLGSYVSMGFTDEDGAPAGDIAEMTDKEAPAPEKEPEEPPHSDELRVEDVALGLDDRRGDYSINVKVRNLNYPDYEGRAIDSVKVSFRFLDEQGDALPARFMDIRGNGGFENLEKGQAGWAGYVVSGSGSHLPLDRETVENAHSIVFDAYEIRFTADESGKNKTIKGTLSDPQVFLLDEILESRKDEPSKKPSPIAVEDVSVSFTHEQPERLKESSLYIPSLHAWAAPVPELSDSMTYAVIHFRITNLTKKEVNLADIGDHFAVQINFDDGFLYSTVDESESIYLYGDDYAIVAGNTGQGKVMAPPLAELDLTLYLPVAKTVATQTDRPLVISFLTDYTGRQQLDFKVR